MPQVSLVKEEREKVKYWKGETYRMHRYRKDEKNSKHYFVTQWQ